MNLFELANAISMVVPLCVWFTHRRKRSHQDTHKMMIIQIPFSFLYHMSNALIGQCGLTAVLRVCDISLIHIYSFIATRNIKRKMSHMINAIDKRFEDTLMLWNTYYIYRVYKGYDDSYTRIIGLYVSSMYAVFGKKECLVLTGLGSLCSLLYLFDDRLNHLGHSMFHIALGGLYHGVLRLE